MGRKSSITRLPKAVRDAIDAELKKGRLTLDELLERLESEFGDVKLPSRASLGRYKKNFDEISKEHREAMQMAQVWAERIGSEPEGDIGRAVVEIMRTLAFRGVQDAYEQGLSPKELSVLSLAMQRIEKAGEIGWKTRMAIRQAAREEALAEAAETAEKVCRDGGMSADLVSELRRQLLGIG